eukprot:748099-Hanusia_phi.AAC.4
MEGTGTQNLVLGLTLPADCVTVIVKRKTQWVNNESGFRQRARRKVASPARTVCSGLHRPHHEGQLKTYYDRPRRIVALGDIHGDVRALATSLRMSDLIDERGNWVGKDSMLVQLGDVLDRGPNDYFCMRLLIKLQKQAREAGGDVICLLGNHEVMNAQLDFRYVDPAAWLGWELEDEGKGKSAQDADPLEIHALPKYMHGRINALRRGHGTLSKTLSTWPVCVVVGDTVFCHGILPTSSCSRCFLTPASRRSHAGSCSLWSAASKRRNVQLARRRRFYEAVAA